jgi:hypothetical protein
MSAAAGGKLGQIAFLQPYRGSGADVQPQWRKWRWPRGNPRKAVGDISYRC